MVLLGHDPLVVLFVLFFFHFSTMNYFSYTQRFQKTNALAVKY